MTLFVNTDASMQGIGGLGVTCMLLFFLFSHNGIKYPCALVHWFSCTSELPNENTGMWVVKSDLGNDGMKHVSIIHFDTVVWAAYLLPAFWQEFVLYTLSFMDTLDTFDTFYVNKYIDHHVVKIAG